MAIMTSGLGGGTGITIAGAIGIDRAATWRRDMAKPDMAKPEV
jgi:hypothetical protein